MKHYKDIRALSESSRGARRASLGVVAAVAAGALLAGCASASDADLSPGEKGQTTRVLTQISAIASEHGGHRAVASSGGIATGDYIVKELRDMGLYPNMVGFEGATEDGTKYKGYNIIVDVVKGRSDNVVMFGAHYDSIGVPGVDAKTPPSDATSTSTPQFGSPGMNDNASGVAALLSIAASNVGAKDRVKTLRLAFWDAEEQGLKGSRNYVESLSDADKSTLSAYVNADMLATKGGIVSIVDADKSGSATYDESAQSWAEDLTFSPEEVELEKQLRNAYPAGTEFLESFDAVTGSDGNPFHLAGVPTTGIGTVSKDPKVYLAPCYHQACDDITNIDNDVLAKNEKALNGLALTLTTS